MSSTTDDDKFRIGPFKYIGALLALVAAMFGSFQAVVTLPLRVDKVEKAVDVMQVSGSQFARERIQAVEAVTTFNDKRLSANEVKAEATSASVQRIESDLRYVVEWVREQKREQNRKTDK